MQSIFENTDRNYAYFQIGDLFKVSGCRDKFTSENIKAFGDGNFPYVTTSASNNGANGLFGNFTEEGNVITVDSATVGSAFYQRFPFTGSDHVEKLTPALDKEKSPLFALNEYIGLFVCSLLNKEMFRYSYGRKFNQTRIKSTRIPLPLKINVQVDPTGRNSVSDIDWDFIESYVQQRCSKINREITSSLQILISTESSAREFFGRQLVNQSSEARARIESNTKLRSQSIDAGGKMDESLKDHPESGFRVTKNGQMLGASTRVIDDYVIEGVKKHGGK